MDSEKFLVRISPDTVLLLQTLVDRGAYDSLASGVSDAIEKMIESKLSAEEIEKILEEHVRRKPFRMESLLSDGDPVSMEEAVKTAVREYVKSRSRPEE